MGGMRTAYDPKLNESVGIEEKCPFDGLK